MIHTLYLDITVAFLLDLILGDPLYRLHPIRLIGKTVLRFEKPFRKISSRQRMNGFLFSVFIISFWFLVVFGFLRALALLDQIWGYPIINKIFSIYIIYSCISIKDLRDKTIEIKRSLGKDSIETTRKKLSLIVGRQTSDLNEKEIIRATVETVAENIVDGILAPLFYVFIGGAPLMILYKTVNTLDSMVGYRNEKYIRFGWGSARIDDIFNFIPARLSSIFIPLASFISFKNGIQSIRTIWRDGQKHPSPNSGIPEAAVAGALGIQLGGVNYYHGKKSIKPLIGNHDRPLTPKHINDTILLAYLSGIIGLTLGLLIVSWFI